MNQKQIKHLLNESCFNPKELGPMKIISDINNIEYYKGKAIELIRQSGSGNAQECLRDAISVLVLARVHLHDKEKL